MADLSALCANLNRLRQEVNQKLPAWLLGRPNNEADEKRRDAEFRDLSDRIKLLIRELKSHENLLRVQQQSAMHTLPRSEQWAQRQRVENLEGIREQAEELAKLVSDQLNRNGINAMQAAKEIQDVVENLDKSFSHSEIAAAMKAGQNLQSAIVPASPQHAAHVGALHVLETGVPVLTFVCILLQWVAAKNRRGKGKSA